MTGLAEGTFDPRAILASLERTRTDFVVIGGLARVLRGANETTSGVDICPSLTGASVDRLRSAVMQLGATGADGLDYRLTPESLQLEAIVELMTTQGPLNLVARPAGIPRGFADLRRAATTEPIGNGLRPRVASAGDLAAMAAALHRDQDVARLPELRRIVELEADRQLTIGPASTATAARGLEPRAPAAVDAPVLSPSRQQPPRRSGPKLG
jgi:hypothetical protein